MLHQLKSELSIQLWEPTLPACIANASPLDMAHERTEATKRIVLVLIKSIIVDMYKIHDHVARYDRFFSHKRTYSKNYGNRIR
jgi:hypothetical protein